MSQVAREYKVVRTIRKNLIWSFAYLILVAIFIVCFLMLWVKIIDPSLKEVKNTSNGIKILNDSFGDLQKIQLDKVKETLNEFFEVNNSGDQNNIQNLALEIQKSFNEYYDYINNTNNKDIILSTDGLINKIKDILQNEAPTMGLTLTEKGNLFINSITKVGDSINNVNKISQSWFNINFGTVLYDLMNNTKNITEIIKDEVPNLLKSKAIIFLIVLLVVLLIIVPLLVKMVLSSIFFILRNGRLEKSTRQSFIFMIFNVAFSPIPLLNLLSWSFIYRRFKKKKQKITFKE
ncbi:MAG: hypothetical protein IKL15_02225 [Mycoplasmataceae bacterium]|nr:hypothetical protein [Mycoplasmataceae bacterium]